MRSTVLALALSAVAPAAVAADGETLATVCKPVATSWPVDLMENRSLDAPTLSVVTTDTRPKDAWLYLDGRFVGRARHFNGKKGYLFLEPGRYRLEIRLDGYAVDAFIIEASSNCRFDIKHRLRRVSGEAARHGGETADPSPPARRVYEPMSAASPTAPTAPPAGADPSLRPDLGSKPPRRDSANPDATLRLNIRPDTASVYIDGAFVATAHELKRMVGGLAIPSGRHEIEVMAPGHRPKRVHIAVEAGRLAELDVTLEPDNASR